MSSEKRLILFTIVTFLSFFAIEYVLVATGIKKPEPPPKKLGDAVAQAKVPEKDQAKPDAPTAPKDAGKVKGAAAAKAVDKPAEPKPPSVPLAEAGELVLGSTAKTGGFHLEVQLEQKGAGVAVVRSSLFEAEFIPGQPKHRPLALLRDDPLAPPSLALTLVQPRPAGELGEAAEAAGVVDDELGEIPLDTELWEVVRGPDGKVVQPATRDGKTKGQTAVFRTKVDSRGLVLTKTYTLFEGDDEFSMDLKIESPEKDQSVVYKLFGPHGVPIEGEWYTGVFRDAVFGHDKGSSVDITTLTADYVVKRKDEPDNYVTQPLKYLGVENQYFAVLMKQEPPPAVVADNPAVAKPIVLHFDLEAKQKADIGVEITSKAMKIGPNSPLSRSYRIFAGPKTVEALAPFGGEDVAFRKASALSIPGGATLARFVITPLLGWTYYATQKVGGLFGKGGNYGVAIIMLTLLVRMVMFPLGRKQALSAKKMQDLQPLVMEIKAKYKDDKEEQGRQTMALYKREGINPVAGCLPLLVQMPIFVGLWQALNNSVNLRHAGFLWIDNLAAPDMLFKVPDPAYHTIVAVFKFLGEMPLIGLIVNILPNLGQYFNLLPFGVVALMLVQTKLFSPPPTSPEAETQQKMMKYMMVFMAFMFYKVPSGLGLYFITSSTWQICERLLLPKVSTQPKSTLDDELGGSRDKPAKPPGRIAAFIEKVMDEAKKDPTYRKLTDENPRNGNSDRDGRKRDGDGDGGRDRRDRGKPRPKPGKKR